MTTTKGLPLLGSRLENADIRRGAAESGPDACFPSPSIRGPQDDRRGA